MRTACNRRRALCESACWIHGRLAKAANTLRDAGRASSNPIVYGLAVMVLIAGMRSMLDLIIMSYALVAWWVLQRLLALGQARLERRRQAA